MKGNQRIAYGKRKERGVNQLCIQYLSMAAFTPGIIEYINSWLPQKGVY